MKYEKALEYVDSRLSPKIKRDFENADRKTMSEVFDRSTLMAIYRLMSRKYISFVDFPISTGKEANVFRGEDTLGNPVAIKIYRTSTGNFRKMRAYIEGDPRFRGLTRDKRKMIFRWAFKEFSNLRLMLSAGIRVPRPISQDSNVLVMEYIGDENGPSPLLKDAEFDAAEAAEFSVDSIVKAYKGAGLVHGDMSEYNILVKGPEFVLIDVSQAVSIKHPLASELLERDISNISRFFSRFGVEVRREDIMRRIGD